MKLMLPEYSLVPILERPAVLTEDFCWLFRFITLSTNRQCPDVSKNQQALVAQLLGTNPFS